MTTKNDGHKTFDFTFSHPTLGRLTGIASIPTNVHWSELTVDDITMKSLENGMGVKINLEIINYPEIKTAKFQALNHLTIKQASKKDE